MTQTGEDFGGLSVILCRLAKKNRADRNIGFVKHERDTYGCVLWCPGRRVHGGRICVGDEKATAYNPEKVKW